MNGVCGVERRGEHRGLAVALPVDQPHLVAVGERSRRGIVLDVAGRLPGGQRAVAQVADRPPAAVLPVDALDEGRDHLSQLGEHGRAGVVGFPQLVGAEAQQQRLEGLPGAVDAEVAARRGGQQAAQRVRCAGAHGPVPGARVVAGAQRVCVAEVVTGRGHEPGVGLERVVERLLVAAPVGRVVDLGRRDVLPAAAGALSVA